MTRPRYDCDDRAAMSTPSWSWERLERSNVDSQAALIELVRPQPGESVLDVGTGSGGLALLAARTGATTTGIDIAESGIERARARAQEERLDIRFEVGDAQSLPYADGAFDVVVSSFGVMFAPDQRSAANELGRVCRVGGRLGLTLMPRSSRAADATSILRDFGDDGDGDHPAAFADRLEELLGDSFELEARLREVDAAPGPSTWEEALAQSDELRTLAATLPPERLADLRTRVEEWLATWRDSPASYVLVVGHRRDR